MGDYQKLFDIIGVTTIKRTVKGVKKRYRSIALTMDFGSDTKLYRKASLQEIRELLEEEVYGHR